jgi:hypothetical protein
MDEEHKDMELRLNKAIKAKNNVLRCSGKIKDNSWTVMLIHEKQLFWDSLAVNPSYYRIKGVNNDLSL